MHIASRNTLQFIKTVNNPLTANGFNISIMKPYLEGYHNVLNLLQMSGLCKLLHLFKQIRYTTYYSQGIVALLGDWALFTISQLVFFTTTSGYKIFIGIIVIMHRHPDGQL